MAPTGEDIVPNDDSTKTMFILTPDEPHRWVYYSHCMAIYGNPQEKRDIKLLESLGFDVLNPSDPGVLADMQKSMDDEGKKAMEFFTSLVRHCNFFAFRSLPDGRIPAGIVMEINEANKLGIPVFELPSNITGRGISVDETREYLYQIGQR